MKQVDIFTKEAMSCLHKSNALAYLKNKKAIQGDDLFWGIYGYMKNSHFEIFCAITGLHHTDLLDEYYQKHYESVFNTYYVKPEKHLPLNKKISTEIQEIVNDGMDKLDLIILFYISFLHLSSRSNKLLKDSGLDKEKIMENCENIINNPVVEQGWIFAFLEVLSKLFTKLHLDPKQIKLMEIKNIQQMDSIDMLLDAVESEIVERGDNKKGNTDTEISDKDKKEQKKLTIEYFGTDLTKEYKDWFIDPIIGRKKEIQQIIYTLLRKTKNNPLLIGEAGVGKTAVVEGLAQQIAKWEVPEKLQNKRIFLLDMGTLVAGTKYRWEFESRMKSILEEATDVTNNIILFIDEIHSIIGAGGQDTNDAAQMIKPLLARGKIKLIGATTFDEYQKHIEKDAALKRRFQEVTINEPDDETTKEMLMGLKETYENYHGVKINEASIVSAISLSKRYILNKHLPDKALDIIDEACARKSTINTKLDNDTDYKKQEEKIAKLQEKIEKSIENQDYFGAAGLKEKVENIKKEMNKMRMNKQLPSHLRPEINTKDVGEVLSDKTGIPASIVSEDEVAKLQRLDADLKERIFGQGEAVDAIVNSLTRNRLSVIKKDKPIGSFIFLGPSGVGKTYLAKLIAKDYFGSEKSLIRIDMSEFMEKHSISKLIGSPAGYVGYDEGGGLTEEVRRKPYSVILFDEIEKASTEVLNILLQILDEGQLKDSKGRWVDFKSTIIIMTSNLGSEEFSIKKNAIGFATDSEKETQDKQFDEQKSRIFDILKDFLTPELLNRIDHKIVFRPLSKKTMTKIFKVNIKEFLKNWKGQTEKKLPTFPDKKVKEIIDKIYDPQHGARPIDRYIQEEVEGQIIKDILKK